MTELLAIKGGDKPRLDKLRRLAKSLQQVQEFAGIKLV
jgi:hypothetical protein